MQILPAALKPQKTVYKELSLPFGEVHIRQHMQAQAASQASALLLEAALKLDETAEPLKVLELGSGSGVLSICLGLARPAWQITGIEIQADLVDLARQNANAAGCEISFLEADLREFQGGFDLILANPPWIKKASGRLSPYAGINISRIELCATMPNILQAVKRLLNPAGKAILIYPGLRKKELEDEARKASLQILKMSPEIGKKAYFCVTLAEGKKI